MVVMDHAPLAWLQQMKDSSPGLTRWQLTLQPYAFFVKHRKGKDHANGMWIYGQEGSLGGGCPLPLSEASSRPAAPPPPLASTAQVAYPSHPLLEVPAKGPKGPPDSTERPGYLQGCDHIGQCLQLALGSLMWAAGLPPLEDGRLRGFYLIWEMLAEGGTGEPSRTLWHNGEEGIKVKGGKMKGVGCEMRRRTNGNKELLDKAMVSWIYYAPPLVPLAPDTEMCNHQGQQWDFQKKKYLYPLYFPHFVGLLS